MANGRATHTHIHTVYPYILQMYKLSERFTLSNDDNSAIKVVLMVKVN